MAADKNAFEVKANVNSVEIAVGENLVRVEAGDTYETTDPEVMRALDAHPSVKKADPPTKAAGGKS